MTACAIAGRAIPVSPTSGRRYADRAYTNAPNAPPVLGPAGRSHWGGTIRRSQQGKPWPVLRGAAIASAHHWRIGRGRSGAPSAGAADGARLADTGRPDPPLAGA